MPWTEHAQLTSATPDLGGRDGSSQTLGRVGAFFQTRNPFTLASFCKSNKFRKTETHRFRNTSRKAEGSPRARALWAPREPLRQLAVPDVPRSASVWFPRACCPVGRVDGEARPDSRCGSARPGRVAQSGRAGPDREWRGPSPTPRGTALGGLCDATARLGGFCPSPWLHSPVGESSPGAWGGGLAQPRTLLLPFLLSA